MLLLQYYLFLSEVTAGAAADAVIIISLKFQLFLFLVRGNAV